MVFVTILNIIFFIKVLKNRFFLAYKIYFYKFILLFLLLFSNIVLFVLTKFKFYELFKYFDFGLIIMASKFV